MVLKIKETNGIIITLRIPTDFDINYRNLHSNIIKAAAMFPVLNRSYKASLVLTSEIFSRSLASKMSDKVEDITHFWFRPDHVP